jgi:nicotinamide-nucleotide amidase
MSRSDQPDLSVAEAVLTELTARGATLATAESLTGGLIGELLTSVPGASAAYLGGVISYATRLKSTLAGVAESTLAELGPVAARTAVEMATGIATRCAADWGLGVTGVAGPDAQDGHRVGQVFIALARRADGQTSVRELSLSGDRAAIRRQTAQHALVLLLDGLHGGAVAGNVTSAAADEAAEPT